MMSLGHLAKGASLDELIEACIQSFGKSAFFVLLHRNIVRGMKHCSVKIELCKVQHTYFVTSLRYCTHLYLSVEFFFPPFLAAEKKYILKYIL